MEGKATRHARMKFPTEVTGMAPAPTNPRFSREAHCDVAFIVTRVVDRDEINSKTPAPVKWNSFCAEFQKSRVEIRMSFVYGTKTKPAGVLHLYMTPY